jgi:uncharacterized protein YecE (DUF72 family)
MPKVYAGTSGWAYSTWKPDFYPAKLPAAKFLSHYATRLNSVEVNYTFRSFPTDALLKRWMEATPAGFKFAIKAHQSITHVKRLHETSGLIKKFAASLQTLEDADKLGPVLFQLPPFLKCDVPRLTQFLAELPSHLRAAFEFRDTSWFVEEVYDALRRKNASLCHAESEEIQTPPLRTADFFYVRLRKDNYSAKSLRARIQRAAELVRQGDVFAYFRHEETPEGALRAEALLAAMSDG